MKKHIPSIILVIIVAILIAFALTPVGLSTVTSDSMEPTLSEGDVYLLVPDGTIESGDIITFYSSTKDRYVTHRVVSETDGGYLTQGDNNRVTDQQTGNPTVTEQMIRGRVVELGGEPLIAPGTAGVLVSIQEYRIPILGVLGLLFVMSFLYDHSTDRFSRHFRQGIGPPHLKYHDVLVATLVVASVFTTAVILIAAPTTAYSLVVVEDGFASGATTIAVNETGELTTEVTPRINKLDVTYVGLTVSGGTVTERYRDGTPEYVIEVGPYESVGANSVEVTSYAYPAILPRGVMMDLHAISPVLAAIASSVSIWLPLGAILILLVPKSLRVRRATLHGLNGLLR